MTDLLDLQSRELARVRQECERLREENARLREILNDTPHIGSLAAKVFSSGIPGMESKEADEINEWLNRRREALGESEASE